MTKRGIARGVVAHNRANGPWRWPLPRTLRRVRLRTWTVLAMVIFAVLGAITAHRGARTEQDTVVVAEKLAQGQLIEVGERQRIRTQTASAAALKAREEAVRAEGQALLRRAAQARQEKRIEDAAWLTMRAHEEFAAARAIRLFRDEFAASSLSTDEENLRVAATLADFGFGTFVHFQAADSTVHASADAPKPKEVAKCRESGSMELSQVWCETRERLEKLHERVRNASLAVAVFVLALAFFTISDACVKARWRYFKWGFFTAGLAIGTIAIAVVLAQDFDALPALLTGLIATPLAWLGLHYVVAYAERKGWVHPEHKDGDEASVHSEEVTFDRAALRAPVLGHHMERFFGVATIVLIAVTVFVSASVGWGYSIANTHADAAAEEANKSAAEMVIRNALYAARQSELVRELAAAAERRTRLGLAHQRVQLSKFGDSMKSQHEDEDERHSEELGGYKLQFRDTDNVMDSENLSVEGDPRFPRRLLWQFSRVPSVEAPPRDEQSRTWRTNDERADRSRNAYEALAHWDLESSHSVAWRNVASSLLGGLMVFAISLYFLGQALAMEPTRSGFVLLTAGIAFGCFGIISSAVSAYPMGGLKGASQVTGQAVEAVLAEKSCPVVYSAAAPSASSHDDDEKRRRELAAYFYAVGTVLSDYRSDEADLERAQHYLACSVALSNDFAFARLKLADVESQVRSLDLGEPYTSLPARGKVRSRIELAEAQDLLQRSGLDLSAAQRNSVAFDMALNALIARDEQALVLADDVVAEALELVKAGKILARPGTAALLDFNLGFVRLARGQFEDGRKAYRAGLAIASDDAFRLSALTDLETVSLLRCKGGKPAPGSDFDCEGLSSAIVDIRKAMLAHQAEVKQPAPARAVAQEDFTVWTTANRLVARLRGFDPEADDLWLVWSRLEPGWESWRTLQRVSLPVTSPRKGDDTIVADSGTISVRHSFLNSYWGAKRCLTEGRYRAEVYAHGTRVAAREIVRPLPAMKAARFRELNLELCMPADWNVVPEQGAAAQQRGNYGVIRGVTNGAGKFAAFVFSFYVPTQSDGLPSCLLPGNAVRCAMGALLASKVIAGDEPLVAFEHMTTSLDRRALVYRAWTSRDGGVHAVFARADSGTPAALWDVLESAEVIYSENELDAAAQK
jgi:hypothetical protein